MPWSLVDRAGRLMVFFLVSCLSTIKETAVKVICPECEEVVKACRLVLPKEIRKTESGETYLSATHVGKPGKRSDQVVNSETGEVVETFCRGSMRIPKELIEEP